MYNTKYTYIYILYKKMSSLYKEMSSAKCDHFVSVPMCKWILMVVIWWYISNDLD